ncbi:MAG: RHS repeat-associated core domain-containing protein, partial [bacterium]|nr:RHS repeat-associated core domain-containing protein [bacterium]
YYVKDQVGTIYKVVDVVNEQFVEERSYDSFGTLVNSTGTTTTNLGFQGKYHDPESGLYYFYNRYYNPANGRFMNEDLIGLNGGLNLYAFANNDLGEQI